jgi:ABC-2 type transport system ATP-binding protein
MGKTLIISSHILSELGEMSTSIGIIERGKLLYSGTMKDALNKARTGERVEIALQPDSAAPELIKASIERDHRVARVVQPTETPSTLFVDLIAGEHGHHFLIENIIASGGKMAAFRPVEIKLEDAFLKLTTGALQ